MLSGSVVRAAYRVPCMSTYPSSICPGFELVSHSMRYLMVSLIIRSNTAIVKYLVIPSIALDVSPFLRGLPEPARASADHRLALTRDVLVPGTFLSCRGERFKPTLNFQVFTEAWTIDVFNVIVANGEPGPSGGDRAPGQGFPACVVQQFHRGRIIQMLHEIDLRELHQRWRRDWQTQRRSGKGLFWLGWQHPVRLPDLSRSFWQARRAAIGINVDPEGARTSQWFVLRRAGLVCFVSTLCGNTGEADAIGF